MASANFALQGDDPLLSADVLTGGVDPSLTAATDLQNGTLPLASPSNDISLESLTANPDSASFIPQGPSLAQLGATSATPGIVGASDPSAANAHSSTAATSGSSILDDILGVGKLAIGAASVAIGRAGAISNPTTTANKVGTAKNPVTGAGTSTSFVWIAIALFIGLFLWAEIKH